jgi:hypothetical protein
MTAGVQIGIVQACVMNGVLRAHSQFLWVKALIMLTIVRQFVETSESFRAISVQS